MRIKDRGERFGEGLRNEVWKQHCVKKGGLLKEIRRKAGRRKGQRCKKRKEKTFKLCNKEEKALKGVTGKVR